MHKMEPLNPKTFIFRTLFFRPIAILFHPRNEDTFLFRTLSAGPKHVHILGSTVVKHPLKMDTQYLL